MQPRGREGKGREPAPEVPPIPPPAQTWEEEEKEEEDLLWPSNFLMMVPRKVFWGATCPLRTGMVGGG